MWTADMSRTQQIIPKQSRWINKKLRGKKHILDFGVEYPFKLIYKWIQLISRNQVAVGLLVASLLGNTACTEQPRSKHWTEQRVGNMSSIGQRCSITSVSTEQGGSRWLREQHGSDYQHISARQILRNWLLTSLPYISLDAMNER